MSIRDLLPLKLLAQWSKLASGLRGASIPLEGAGPRKVHGSPQREADDPDEKWLHVPPRASMCSHHNQTL